jgi:hypothetical protein
VTGIGMAAPGGVPPIVEQARDLLDDAASSGVTVRALGGIAVFMHAADTARRALARQMEDLDFAVTREASRGLGALFARHGYGPNGPFNALNGARRLMFVEDTSGRHVDVFVERFEMCHVVPFTNRLTVDERTLPLAELLLTKLQIIHLNRKDVIDTCSLLLSHPVGNDDHETVNAGRVAELCADDWGLQHTLEINLARVLERLPEVPIAEEERQLVAYRIGQLRQAMDDYPKSRKWKLRDRIGERKRWYEEPEEVDRSGLEQEGL